MSARRNGHVKKKADLAGLDDGSALAELLRPFYEALIEQAYQDAAESEIDVSFDLENEYVQGVLDQLAQTITDIAETTRGEVREIIAEGSREGWSVEGIQQALRLRGSVDGRSRALLIARSESARAYSLGSQAAWKESGVVDRKQWLASADSCDDCQALDGAIVGLDEEFLPGVATVPLHPACTCVLQPVLAE